MIYETVIYKGYETRSIVVGVMATRANDNDTVISISEQEMAISFRNMRKNPFNVFDPEHPYPIKENKND